MWSSKDLDTAVRHVFAGFSFPRTAMQMVLSGEISIPWLPEDVAHWLQKGAA